MKTNKHTILWGLVILLAVLNIATIATIINRNKRSVEDKESIRFKPDEQAISGRHIHRTLNFDSSQMEVFRSKNREFKIKAQGIIHDINLQKEALFIELQAATPDSLKLNQISEEIGALHAELKKITVKFYLSLSKICTNEQKVKLNTLFDPLFKDTPLPSRTRENGANMHGKAH